MGLTKTSIGIVGGMGPAAGIDLSAKLVSQTLAANDQEHLPFVLFSFPDEIGDRSEYVQGKIKENPGLAIGAVLMKMEQAGAVVAGMACNTAHIPEIYDAVMEVLARNNSRLGVLHMIKEVGKFIRTNYPGKTRAGILGTSGTYFSGLYDILSENGLEVINVSEGEQEILHSAMYHPGYGIKSLPRGVSAKALDILHGTAGSLKRRGAEVLVFACTELSVLYGEHLLEGLPVVDSNMVLARALIHAFAPEKLRAWQPGT